MVQAPAFSPLRDLSNALHPIGGSLEKHAPALDIQPSAPPPPPPSLFIFSPYPTKPAAPQEQLPPMESILVTNDAPASMVHVTSSHTDAQLVLAILRFQKQISPITFAAGNIFFAALIKTELSIIGCASWGLLALLCFGVIKPPRRTCPLTAADIAPHINLALQIINSIVCLRNNILRCEKPDASLGAFLGTWALAASSGHYSSIAFLWVTFNLAFALPSAHTTLAKYRSMIASALAPVKAAAYDYPKSIVCGAFLLWIQVPMRTKVLSAIASHLAAKAVANNNAEAAKALASEMNRAEETVKVMASKGLAQARRMSLGGKQFIMHATGGRRKHL